MHVTIHNFDILCLSELYLHSRISSNDDNFTIPVYDYHRADHPSNVKQWERESLIYYKNFIPLKLIDIHYTRLHLLQKENRGKIM